MIPKINQQGRSFKGVMAYLMHDKESQETAERVEWFETGNMITDDPHKAAKVMAWTDLHADDLKRQSGGSTAGRKTEKGAVYHYSLAWAQGENPEQEHQRQTALATLERLGLSQHEFVIVAHNDTEHAHLHVVVNLTHPDTGKRAQLGLDKKELQKWALEYEREHGLHCEKRLENALARENGEHVKHQEQKRDYAQSVTRAFYASDSGKAFIHALNAEGLHLAKSGRGNSFVIVDDKGDIQKLARNLEIEERGKLKTAAIKSKLNDIDTATLHEAAALSKQIKADLKPEEQAEKQEQKQAALDKAAAIEKEQAAAQERAERERKAEQAAAERKARYERIQKRIDEKTAHSRKLWNIDELTAEKEQTQNRLNELSGFWARHVFKRKEYTQTAEQLRNVSLQLEERRERFRADIEAFNKNRPEWLRKAELEKHGLGEAQETGGDSGELGKPQEEQAAIREAMHSDEAAERIGEHVQPKTAAEKSKVAAIKTRAESRKAERVISKESAAIRERMQDEQKQRDEKHKREEAARLARDMGEDFKQSASPESIEQERARLAEEAYNRAMREQLGFGQDQSRENDEDLSY